MSFTRKKMKQQTESQVIVCSSQEELSNFHGKKALDPQYTCDICDKKYSSRSVLKIHQIRHKKKEDLPFSCLDCDFQAAAKRDLIRHENCHQRNCNKEVFKCESCPKVFRISSSLSEHIKSVHTKEIIYQCGKCSFSSARRSSIRAHLKNHDESTKLKFICPVCSAPFQINSSLKAHLMSHADIRPFSCNKCDKSFTFSSRLIRHQQEVHAPKTFECDTCLKRFSSVHLLKRHSFSHTGEKPFVCCFCSFASSTQGNLVKHVRNIHDKLNFTYKDILSESGVKRDPKKDLNLDQIQELTLYGEIISKSHLEKLKNKGLTTASLTQLQHDAKLKTEAKVTSLQKISRRKVRMKKSSKHYSDSKKSDKANSEEDTKVRKQINESSTSVSKSFDLSYCENFILPSIGEGGYVYQPSENASGAHVLPTSSIQVMWDLGNSDKLTHIPKTDGDICQESLIKKSKIKYKNKKGRRGCPKICRASPHVDSPLIMLDENELNFNNETLGRNHLEESNFVSNCNTRFKHNRGVDTKSKQLFGSNTGDSSPTHRSLPPMSERQSLLNFSNFNFDNVETQTCVFCQGQHQPQSCEKYPSVFSRRKVARQRRLCFTCLCRHAVGLCRSTNTCHWCNEFHHFSLCTKKHKKTNVQRRRKDINPVSSNSRAWVFASSDSCPSKFEVSSVDEPNSSTITKAESTITVSSASPPLKNTSRPKQIIFDQDSHRSIIVQPLHEPVGPFSIPYIPTSSQNVENEIDLGGIGSTNAVETTDVIHDCDKIYKNFDICNQFLHFCEDYTAFDNTDDTSNVQKGKVISKPKVYVECQEKDENIVSTLRSDCEQISKLPLNKAKECQTRIKIIDRNSHSTLKPDTDSSVYRDTNILFSKKGNKITVKNASHPKKQQENHSSCSSGTSTIDKIWKDKNLGEVKAIKKELDVPAEEVIIIQSKGEILSNVSTTTVNKEITTQPMKEITIKNSLSSYSFMNDEVEVLSIAEIEESHSEIVIEINIP